MLLRFYSCLAPRQVQSERVKRLAPLFLVTLLAWSPVAGVGLLVGTSAGCAIVQPSAYKTLNIIATSVDAGMNAFADAVKAGKVGTETQAKVRLMHGRYQPALQAAVVAARFDTSKPAPDDLKALATELLKLITEAVKL